MHGSRIYSGSETVKTRARAKSKQLTDKYHQNNKLNKALIPPISHRKVALVATEAASFPLSYYKYNDKTPYLITPHWSTVLRNMGQAGW